MDFDLSKLLGFNDDAARLKRWFNLTGITSVVTSAAVLLLLFVTFSKSKK